MRIFVTGATGYIGFAVAQALSRAGHEVHGLVRSAEKAVNLAQNEIHPVVGSLQKPDTWTEIARESSVLVHAAFDLKADSVAVDRAAIQALIDCARHGPRLKTLVYTSGVWVYGNTGNRSVDETSPLSPAALVAWRPDNERMVLNADGLRPIVVRPGCVYGRSSGLTGMLFGGALRDKALRVIGDGANRWTMVHVDDLADGYVRVVESGLTGEVFNFTDRSRNTVGEMAAAVARVTGYTGEIARVPLSEATKTLGGFAECFALDQHVDSRKAVRLLGWQPKHGGFVDGVETYFTAWKAAQGLT